MSTTRVGIIASWKRLPVSHSANPRYEVTLTDGTVLRTQPDGAVNYDIENWAEAQPVPWVRFTIERGQIVGGVELTPPGTQFQILRDGKPVAVTEHPLRWFHQNHPFSMDYAIKHAGYAVEPIQNDKPEQENQS